MIIEIQEQSQTSCARAGALGEKGDTTCDVGYGKPEGRRRWSGSQPGGLSDWEMLNHGKKQWSQENQFKGCRTLGWRKISMA